VYRDSLVSRESLIHGFDQAVFNFSSIVNREKATIAGPHAQRIHSMGGKVGGLQADPAKQKDGGPCSECRRTQSIKWYKHGGSGNRAEGS
jgi:hypothetical protein